MVKVACFDRLLEVLILNDLQVNRIHDAWGLHELSDWIRARRRTVSAYTVEPTIVSTDALSIIH